VIFLLSLLESLYTQAQRNVSLTVSQVPAAYTTEQRQSLRLAAEIAGIHNVHVLSDGLCACICYVATHELPDTPTVIAVVDVGHRFATVTIARVSKVCFHVIAGIFYLHNTQ